MSAAKPIEKIRPNCFGVLERCCFRPATYLDSNRLCRPEKSLIAFFLRTLSEMLFQAVAQSFA